MLTISAISKQFGGLHVLEDVSLTVPDRGIFGLIGPNGAGKTTLFNLITGLYSPNRGAIDFFGQRLNGLPPYRITRAGIARTFQNIRIFKDMSLLENVLVAMGRQRPYSTLAMLAWSSSFRAAERRERRRSQELLEKVGLGDKAGLLAGQLSYGEQRRLEIARALATDPKLLLLDEPAAGMNSVEKTHLMDQIMKLTDDGLGVLMIEHDMRFIMGLSQRITVLNFGEIIAQGTPEEVRENPRVIEAYLGREEEL